MKYDGYFPLSELIKSGYLFLAGKSIGKDFPSRTTVKGTLPSFATFWTK